jgi:hypothetical protein
LDAINLGTWIRTDLKASIPSYRETTIDMELKKLGLGVKEDSFGEKGERGKGEKGEKGKGGKAERREATIKREQLGGEGENGDCNSHLVRFKKKFGD